MIQLDEPIDIYRQGTASRQYSLNEIKKRQQSYNNERLSAKIAEARALNDEAATLEYRWETNKDTSQSARRGSVETDNKIDSVLSAIHRIAESNTDLPGDTPKKRHAQELVETLFPTGVYPITSKSFERQNMLVSEALDRLQGELSEHVDVLGLETHVEQLAELNEKFGEQLSIADHDAVSFDEVQAARQEAREVYYKVLFIIYGDYCDDAEARRDLLEPVVHQQERIARHIQRRGEIPEVDPESGEPTHPNETPTPNDGGGSNDGGSPSEPTDSEPTDSEPTEPTDSDNTTPDEPT